MRFRLLGPLRAETERGSVDLGPPKQRAVLAILLLNANRVVSTERIIDLVWGENPPRTADHSVQIYISELRKVLSDVTGADLIETRSPGYVLEADPDDVDALLFERLARDGVRSHREGDFETCISTLEHALELWSGTPLQEFAYHDFARSSLSSLSEARADAIEALADSCLQTGESGQARDYCRRLIEDEPLREGPRRLMMLALYRSGRQAEALREFGSYQRLLSEELGIEPSEALRDLEERILLQDPRLVDVNAASVDGGNPYRGLRSFREEDSDVYFGREDLIGDVVERLGAGSRLVVIVGPSGSGKSSALAAGIIPDLRAAGHTVVTLQPGARPLWELADSLHRTDFGSRATILRRLESDTGALGSLVDRPLVAVVDQLEELFTLAEPDVATRFGEMISAAISDPGCGLDLVVALRADYFDRPLSMPSLAPLFAAATVSVGPITAQGLERAIVEPAKKCGRAVEPELLAELIADMRHQPGALPLLQFTLFELYERSQGDLTLEVYRHMGGLRGALSAAADEILGEIDQAARELSEQLFMRLVKKNGMSSTARPARLRELLELGDRLDLQRILEAFGERRLLTFSRDAANVAIVEIAHEYLITGWPQLETWIAAHSEDLERLSTLEAAVDEWESNSRSEDFLFRGERLQRAVEWRDATSLRLTSAESAFVEASIEVRDRPPPPPDVVVWFSRRGDGSFGDLVGAGVDRSVEAFGVDVLEHTGQVSQIGAVEAAIARGTPLVFIDSLEAANPLILDLAAGHPSTFFVLMGAAPVKEDLAGLANVRRLVAASEEMGFLAGAVAGLATSKGTVGFIGGLDYAMIREFQAGYEQGTTYLNPGCKVESVYLTGDREMMDTSGFNSVPLGEAAAAYLHRVGADVIFHAAGASGWGMFRWAANLLNTTGERVWTIGVDIDQAKQLEILEDEWDLDPSDLRAMQDLMLTSIIWRLDLGIRDAIGTYREFGLVNDVRADVRGGAIGFAVPPRVNDEGRAVIEGVTHDMRRGRMVISRKPTGEVRRLLDVLGS